MFEEVAELLVKNVRAVLNENWQSRAYDGSLKNGNSPKRASSDLINNITTEIEYDDNGFPETFVLYMMDYWYWVDEGRKPGRFPPVNVIRNWILEKPINFPPINGKIPSIEQQTYLIGRSIAERGSYGIDFTTIASERTLIQATEIFGDAYADQIEEFLDLTTILGSSQIDLAL